MAYSQYFDGLFSSLLPNAAITDNTPPTFAGIISATPGTNGHIEVAWAAASDATPPVDYLIYIALGSVSAGTLFNSSNLVTISPAGTLSKKIFTLADQTTYLINGQIYTFGVRARDAVGNINTNTAIMNATGIGYVDLPGSFQNTETLLAADHVNFQADHANFQTDHTNLQTAITNLNTTSGTIIGAVEALAGGPELEVESNSEIDLEALSDAELELEADEE